MLKALKTVKQQEAAAASPANDGEKHDGEEPAAIEFGSLVKVLNLQRLKGQSDKPKIANRRRYSNPEAVEKIEQ